MRTLHQYKSRHAFPLFEFMFGHKPTMPIDIDMATNIPEDQLLSRSQRAFTVTSWRNGIPVATAPQTSESKHQASLGQAERVLWSQTCKPWAYKVGAKVLKNNFLHKKRKGGKMDTRLVGPYIITKNIGKGKNSFGIALPNSSPKPCKQFCKQFLISQPQPESWQQR